MLKRLLVLTTVFGIRHAGLDQRVGAYFAVTSNFYEENHDAQ